MRTVIHAQRDPFNKHIWGGHSQRVASFCFSGHSAGLHTLDQEVGTSCQICWICQFVKMSHSGPPSAERFVTDVYRDVSCVLVCANRVDVCKVCCQNVCSGDCKQLICWYCCEGQTSQESIAHDLATPALPLLVMFCVCLRMSRAKPWMQQHRACRHGVRSPSTYHARSEDPHDKNPDSKDPGDALCLGQEFVCVKPPYPTSGFLGFANWARFLFAGARGFWKIGESHRRLCPGVVCHNGQDYDDKEDLEQTPKQTKSRSIHDIWSLRPRSWWWVLPTKSLGILGKREGPQGVAELRDVGGVPAP